jgi:hypothetical protein
MPLTRAADRLGMAEKEAYTVILGSDFQDLIPEFIENRRRELQALRVALAAGRYDQLSELGHRMKGSAHRMASTASRFSGDRSRSQARIADRRRARGAHRRVR